MASIIRDKKRQEELILRLFEEVWNQGKLSVLEDIFTPDILIHIGEQTVTGRDKWLEVIKEWRTGFPDIRYVVESIIHSEEHVTCRWKGTGTHLGIFNGLAPSKKKMSYDGITIFRVSQGKCAEAWLSANLLKLMDDLKIRSSKTYTKEDFHADFKGPAGKIYEWLMNSREEPSCKQTIANTLRDLFRHLPPNNQPALIVSNELFENISREEREIPRADQTKIRCLVYKPKQALSSYPILLYAHGGGWSIGTAESADLVTRKLAYLSGCIVVSVDYRLAPEFPFPHGLEDCFTVYQWMRANGEQIQGNKEKVAIAGDSSGGNLVFALALKARDQNKRLPEAILSLCPLTDFQFEKYASALTLSPNGLLYDFSFASFVRSIYAPYNQWQHPYVSPMYADLDGLPPSFILSAGEDMLIDENRVFAKKLEEANVSVEHVIHPSMPHAYYYYLGLTKEEDEAFQKMAHFLRKYLRC